MVQQEEDFGLPCCCCFNFVIKVVIFPFQLLVDVVTWTCEAFGFIVRGK